jgi:hypothetical protein
MPHTALIDTSPLSLITIILIAIFLGIAVIRMGLRTSEDICVTQWIPMLNLAAHSLLLVIFVMFAIRLGVLLILNAPTGF